MPRHSKHSCSNNGKFSNYERQLLKYGTTTERLGKDSIKNFDSCTLCLNDVIIPVICNKGHIFCKECILTSLIDQKKEIKRKEKEWDQYQNKLKYEEDLKLEKQHQDSIKDFEKNVLTLEGIGNDNNNNITTTTTTTTTTGTNNNNKEKIEIVEKDIKLNSYWVITPDNKDRTIEKPRSYTVCPADGKHPLKSAQLINVHFTNVKASSDSNDSNNQYCCPICNKVLSNSTKTRLLKRCGHVFCSCLDKQKDSSSSSSSCYICDKPYTEDEIIQIHSGGTGFSGSGSNLEAKKYTHTAII
ncbi:hypothetical protein RB653_007117 [Dictyostelium firmibasis]|uniref:Nitric oxide synthase-interacting protein homolog n=1 Tax=Dictyostelium firmibasis TaxID=79012 RepID=A0AAN7TU30_9MYCE